MIASLRDDLVTRTEIKSAARRAAAEAACQEAQEILTEELEERLRKHWPRKGRTEVNCDNLFTSACPWSSLECFGCIRNIGLLARHTHVIA